MKEAFERMTGMPDAWTNPALMVSRNAFIQGWEARAQHDVDATIIQYHEATIKRLEKRIEELAQPVQEPWCMKMNGCKTKCADCPDEPAQEPVAWLDEEEKIIYWHNTHETDDYHGFRRTTPLYTTPQQRPWMGLTDEEIDYLYVEHRGDGGPTAICEQFAKAYETYLKEKNNG